MGFAGRSHARRHAATLRLLGLGLLLAAPLRAADSPPASSSMLQPREVAVVANYSDGYSVELAKYYMERRGIPERQLLVTGMPTARESVSRHDYEQFIAEPLKDFLVDEKLDHVRCVVLMYGVPLKVLEPEPSPDSQQMERLIRDEREDSLKTTIELIAAAGKLAGRDPAGELPTFDPKERARRQLQEFSKRLLEDMQAARRRIGQMPQGEERRAAEASLAEIQATAFGSMSQDELNGDEEAPQTFESLPPDQKQLLIMANQATTPDQLKELLVMLRARRGAFGSLAASENLLARVKPDWTSRAAVDSELTTLFWPRFPLARWVRNPLNARLRAPGAPRTLMVCRLDGPTPDVVRRVIDDSLKAEAEGLQGKAYLDSRGLGGSNAYGRVDNDLVQLARMLEEQTTITTVLDEKGALFQPGSCPDAALYCGWYSLGKYVPAFTFATGAIGFHIASSEAATLKKEGSKAWCPNLLRDGVVATLGPVEEPYLTAFPYPTDFFGLMLTGRVTLAEAYFKSLPSLSWMMTLIGDPLYCPWKTHPALDTADYVDYIDR